MKLLRLLYLLSVMAIPLGCSSAPSGSAGDANDPALTDETDIDEAEESGLAEDTGEDGVDEATEE
jgi:hypothetical protein